MAGGAMTATTGGRADEGAKQGGESGRGAVRIEEVAASATKRSVDYLLSLQDADGWWKGDLETNVTMDAEDLLLRQFLGIRTDEETAATAKWIRSNQREDGTWATFHG